MKTNKVVYPPKQYIAEEIEIENRKYNMDIEYL